MNRSGTTFKKILDENVSKLTKKINPQIKVVQSPVKINIKKITWPGDSR